ncbi:hypothetical protein EZS27_006558 [termite gut metagenome]|uniref:IS1 transposase n=1 Tax=termite gut metagenome TaxID=433724 RepID=A0A5J4SJ42_9ZZZZ
MNKIASDYYSPYEQFVPPEKHLQSKKETFTIEGTNSLFRHFLAWMRRKSKCYSKCKTMLELSFLLLIKLKNSPALQVVM